MRQDLGYSVDRMMIAPGIGGLGGINRGLRERDDGDFLSDDDRNAISLWNSVMSLKGLLLPLILIYWYTHLCSIHSTLITQSPKTYIKQCCALPSLDLPLLPSLLDEHQLPLEGTPTSP